MICSRPVHICRGGAERTLGLVIDLHRSGRDVSGTRFSTANFRPFSPRHQNGAVAEKRGGVSVTPCLHVPGVSPFVEYWIVDFRRIHWVLTRGTTCHQYLAVREEGGRMKVASGVGAGRVA